MDLREIVAEIEVVKAKMMETDPCSIVYSELTVALVMLQDTYIKQAEMLLKDKGLI